MEISSKDKEFMEKAIELSIENIQKGGGPFGAVIVKDGKIVAAKANSVIPSCDPTAHAEVNTIRAACKELGTHCLKGCILYTSCEPCPMCLSAIYWARIDKFYYGNTREDAKAIKFDDNFIYDEIPKKISERAIPGYKIEGTNAIDAFKAWEKNLKKAAY